jgi:hypothetical protein
MSYRLLPEVSSQVARAIFVSGGTRTGTSMMAKLLYSLDKVECFHEPAFLYAFMYTINSVPERDWKLLFEAFLVEELLLQALAGRRLNFNEHDQSCVLSSLTRAEVEARLARTHRHIDLVPRAAQHRLAVKMPETIPALERLRSYYPEMTFLVMLRRPESVIASLLERGWYSAKQMVEVGGDWVFRDTSLTPLKIAPWVTDDLIPKFVAASEIERCAMCYVEQYRYLAGRKDCLIVDYDQLVAAPHAYFGRVAEQLGERFGERTVSLLDAIREPGRHPQIATEQIAPPLLAEMRDVYARCRELALPLKG